MIDIDSEIERYRNLGYDAHIGPNGEVSGDIVVCIDVEDIREPYSNFMKLYEKYIILNPDGGSNDLSLVIYGDDGVLYDYYYKWNRFITVDKFRELQIDKLI